MRHVGIARSPYNEGNKRIPLNTIVLPPLSPKIVENGTQLLLVNKTKSGVNTELVTVSRSQDGTPKIFERSSGNVRIPQLEQNIKFLQDQHQIMLNELHNEIETLRNTNRDLQFQLIFSKNQPSSPQISSTSSSDDEHKIFSSPDQSPFTPSLHVELLEKMIGDMKIQLQENESRNLYLSAIVEEQKKKLERYERDRERERERALQAEPELRRKVEESDAIIRRLQRENKILRRDSSTGSPSHYHQRDNYLRGDSSHQNRENQSRSQQRENSGHNHQHQNGSYSKSGRGSRRHNSTNYRSNWFPPLHTAYDYYQGGKRSGNHDKRSNPSSENVLPNVNGSQHHQERSSGNNNHPSGEAIKHLGGQHKGGEPS